MTRSISHCLEDGQLQAFLDNLLDTEQQRQVKSHLTACTSCRLRLEELRELDEWFQGVNLGLPNELTFQKNHFHSGEQGGPNEMDPSAEHLTESIDTDAAWRRFLKRITQETYQADASGTALESTLDLEIPVGRTDQPQKQISERPFTAHRATGLNPLPPAKPFIPRRTLSTQKDGTRKRENSKERKRQMKKWTVTAAAILLGGALLANPGIRSAAADMLNVFRVENLDTVKMSLQELDKISMELETKVGGIDLRDYGKAEVLERPRHTFIERSENPEQFATFAATLPRLPDDIVKGLEQGIRQFTTHKIRYTLDVENVNRLIQALGGEKLLPRELDGESLLFTFPGEYVIQWYKKVEHEDGSVYQDTHYQLAIRDLPKVETSAAVNMKTLQESLTSLPFLSYDVKQQLSDIQRFTNTMLMPELLEAGEEKVDLGGHPALYRNYGVDERRDHQLTWIADGKLIRFDAYEVSREEFLKAARSIQWPKNNWERGTLS